MRFISAISESRFSNFVTFSIENDGFQASKANMVQYKVPNDYKFHCFGNKISHIDCIVNRFVKQGEIAMNLQWQPMPFRYQKHPDSLPKKPYKLESMIKFTQMLCLKTYVRIDLYNVYNQIYIGEFTFTPAGGTDIFTPNEWDKKLGEMWKM